MDRTESKTLKVGDRVRFDWHGQPRYIHPSEHVITEVMSPGTFVLSPCIMNADGTSGPTMCDARYLTKIDHHVRTRSEWKPTRAELRKLGCFGGMP